MSAQGGCATVRLYQYAECTGLQNGLQLDYATLDALAYRCLWTQAIRSFVARIANRTRKWRYPSAGLRCHQQRRRRWGEAWLTRCTLAGTPLRGTTVQYRRCRRLQHRHRQRHRSCRKAVVLRRVLLLLRCKGSHDRERGHSLSAMKTSALQCGGTAWQSTPQDQTRPTYGAGGGG